MKGRVVDGTGTGRKEVRPAQWQWWAAVYFLGAQPLVLFLVPLVRYDEFRLPGVDSPYLLSVSVQAWWGLIVTLFGLQAGRRLLRGDSNVRTWVDHYLLISLFFAVGLLALALAIPYQTFLRKAARLELVTVFFQGAGILAAWLVYSRFVGRKGQASVVHRTEDQTVRGWDRAWGDRVCPGVDRRPGLFVGGVPHQAAGYLRGRLEGNATAVQRFVLQGVDVNATTIRGNTPLHLARSKDVADFLMSISSHIQEAYMISAVDILDLRTVLTELGLVSNPVSLSLRNQLGEEFWVRASDRRTPTHQITSDLVKTLNQFVFSGRPGALMG